MANELNLALGQTGQTITARLIAAGAYVGGTISLSELPAGSGFYTGNVPAGTAADTYDVIFLSGSTINGSGKLYWDGVAEVGLLELATRTWAAATRSLTGAVTVSGVSAGAITADAIASNAITAAKLAADATTKIQAGLLQAGSYTAPDNTGISTLLTRVSNTRAANLDNLDAAISSRLDSNAYSAPPAASAIATQVWAAATNGLTGVGTVGKLLADNINATITSRLAADDYGAAPSAGTVATTVQTQLASSFIALANLVEARPLLAEIEASTVLAKPSHIEALQAHGDASWATATGFSSHTPADVWSHTTRALTGTVAANVTQVTGVAVTNVGDFKADVSGLATQVSIDALPNLAQIEASTVLTSNDYTAPPTSDAIATAVTTHLTDAFAALTSAVADIPITPLLSTDERLDSFNSAPITVSGQFEAEDKAALQALLDLARADEVMVSSRYQKLAAGTGVVLLDKDVTNDGAGNVSLVKRP